MRLFWVFTLCLLMVGAGLGSTVHAQECVYTGTPPAAVSKRHTQIRVLTHNVFGKRADSNQQCWDRMATLGRYIAKAAPRFDIVALQEHWNTADANLVSCGAKVLDEAIKSTGRYRQSSNFYRWRPKGELHHFETDGGISTYAAYPISKFEENEWDSIPGILNILHGSIFARIPLNGTAVTIDFYQAHLLAKSDGCDQECRRKELLELRKEIRANSRNSGNPVLVAGDFNIGGPTGNSTSAICDGNPGYGDIMFVLGNPRDLWREAYPNGEGFTVDCAHNTTLQAVESCSDRERIDYLFAIEDPELSNSRYRLTLAKPGDIQLVRLQTNSKRHVSDHFGIQASLEVREAGRAGTNFRANGGRCLEAAGGQTADGTAIQLFDCNGTLSQQWTLRHTGEMVGLSGKCLTVTQGASSVRSAVLATCTGAPTQRFDYTFSGQLRASSNSNLCLEPTLTSNRAQVRAVTCAGNNQRQRWKDD